MIWRLRLYIIINCGILAVVLSCGDATTAPPKINYPASLIIVSGQDQSALAGTELPGAIQVKVVDSTGKAIRGQLVNFKVVSGGGSVFAGSAITTDSGLAKERWTLGRSAADSQRVEARAVDQTTGAGLVFGVFRATATVGAVAKLVLTTTPSVSPSNRTVFVVQPVIQSLDVNDNPVAGTTVTAAITAGGGTLGGTTVATSTSTGLATFTNLFRFTERSIG